MTLALGLQSSVRREIQYMASFRGLTSFSIVRTYSILYSASFPYNHKKQF